MEGSARKKIRKQEPSTSKSDGATQSVENTLDLSTYLTYDILRIVFQYLTARDLTSATMVCRSWLEAANNEKWTRGPCCFMQRYVRNDLLSSLMKIRIKPSVGFFFISENTRVAQDHIVNLLPKHCEAIMLYGPGVVMDNKEIEEHPFPSIVCAFLPQIPNVRIRSFKVPECRIIQKTTVYQEIISTIVNQEASALNHKTSTCFMLFCNYVGHTTAKRWASAVETSEANKVVSVWGGVLESIYVQRAHITRNEFFRQRKDIPTCFAVLITGSIQTWSIVLDKRCNTKERTEAKLKLFKDEVKLKKHSIGFMFVCKDRGFEMYQTANVESTIFKRLFPQVPLVGCFGYGEIGKTTTVNEVNEESDEEEYASEVVWYNEVSTVFLILTYG